MGSGSLIDQWTTIERKCYAIDIILQKYEKLLQNIPFQFYTDHGNLVYLNNPLSNEVLRWKLAIQEYNFTISHIAGEYNVVADGFSRLKRSDLKPTQVGPRKRRAA